MELLRMDEQIKLALATYPTLCFKETQIPPTINDNFLLNFIPNSGTINDNFLLNFIPNSGTRRLSTF